MPLKCFMVGQGKCCSVHNQRYIVGKNKWNSTPVPNRPSPRSFSESGMGMGVVGSDAVPTAKKPA